MADKPTSPFSGLDKALLRSTKPSTSLPVPPEKNHNINREESIGVSDKVSPEPTNRPGDVSTTRPIDEAAIRPDNVPTGRREVGIGDKDIGNS